MLNQESPWILMWSHPRAVIRTLLQTKPRYGVLVLATIYVLQGLFYFANYWSLGFSYSSLTVLVASLVLAPFVGVIWVYLSGWFLSFTGSWFGGKAPQSHLRLAVSWSKIPVSINLVMWFVLLLSHPDYVFIQDAGGPTILFINFITMALSFWSFILLIQAIREVQGFSIGRTLSNLFVAWFIYYAFLFVIFMIFRLMQINLH